MTDADVEFLRFVGSRIRDYRRALGLSQERLSELASVHPTYISSLEGGKANASIAVFRRVAAALQVPLVQLLDVQQKLAEPDAVTKAFLEIKRLDQEKQKMCLATIKGLLAGMKNKQQ